MHNRKPTRSAAGRWIVHLWREWTTETWRPISPASAKPGPSKWSDAQVTLAWIGHSTVLINFFGVIILTDPVLFPRIGIRLPGFTIGPKRLTAPALSFDELPKIDLVLLSHAHFDHLDLRTLQRFNENYHRARHERFIEGHPVFRRDRTRMGPEQKCQQCRRRDRDYRVSGEPLGRTHAARHVPRLQRLSNPEERTPNYFRRRHGDDRKLRCVKATRPNRCRNHVHQRLQSVDSVALHA